MGIVAKFCRMKTRLIMNNGNFAQNLSVQIDSRVAIVLEMLSFRRNGIH